MVIYLFDVEKKSCTYKFFILIALSQNKSNHQDMLKKPENFYSVSTFSNDLKHNFNQNLETFDMGKKWNKFLISMYTKK